MTRLIGVILGFIGLVALGFFLIYNRLVVLRNRFRSAYAQIDVQLKRRHELIPNLVETARAYLAHERATLEAVIAARTRAVQAREQAAAQPGEGAALARLGAAESALGGALAHLFAVAEAYPDLKADANLARLMEALASTENRVAFARQAFNEAVMTYNSAIEVFPNILVAGPMRFVPARFFRDHRRRRARRGRGAALATRGFLRPPGTRAPTYRPAGAGVRRRDRAHGRSGRAARGRPVDAERLERRESARDAARGRAAPGLPVGRRTHRRGGSRHHRAQPHRPCRRRTGGGAPGRRAAGRAGHRWRRASAASST